MTKNFYKTHNALWFANKKATALNDIKNNGGEIIQCGETVIISGKSGAGGLNVKSQKGVYIKQIHYSELLLLT